MSETIVVYNPSKGVTSLAAGASFQTMRMNPRWTAELHVRVFSYLVDATEPHGMGVAFEVADALMNLDRINRRGDEPPPWDSRDREAVLLLADREGALALLLDEEHGYAWEGLASACDDEDREATAGHFEFKKWNIVDSRAVNGDPAWRVLEIVTGSIKRTVIIHSEAILTPAEMDALDAAIEDRPSPPLPPGQRENENCLAGLACPKCSSRGPLRIVVRTRMVMTDEGSDADDRRSLGDLDWDDDAMCECLACGHEATVCEFRF
jgi:hypothetical protein